MQVGLRGCCPSDNSVCIASICVTQISHAVGPQKLLNPTHASLLGQVLANHKEPRLLKCMPPVNSLEVLCYISNLDPGKLQIVASL
jgi:hypothetical protein